MIRFFPIGKRIFFDKERADLSQNFNFGEIFLLLKYKNKLTSFYTCVENMAGSGIRIDHPWHPNRGNTRVFVLYKTPTVLICSLRYAKSAHHGQLQKQ